MNDNNYFKRIVDECFYDGLPMHPETYKDLLERDEKKKFMEVLLKYRRIEGKFHIKVVDASAYKAMNACIVKDIYRNDKLIATKTIDWEAIDWTEEDTASYEIKVAEILEAILDECFDEYFRYVS